MPSQRPTLYLLATVVIAIFTGACQHKWRIVVLPDTQHYAQDHPESLLAMTAWLREEAERGGIDAVLHVGDIVDEDEDLQWQVADEAFESLDGVVPYVLAVGNHDFAYDGSRDSRFTHTFPASRLQPDGVFEPGRSENYYRILALGQEEVLVLSLEVFPRDEVVDWARSVLEDNADTQTFLVTHAFLYTDGLRYGQPGAGEQNYGVDALTHVTGTGPGAANDAETLYQELVAPFSQVHLVFSGHVLGKGVAYRKDARPDGSVAHQILQNYQMREGGGEGYLRIYTGYGDRVEVETYSPLLHKHLRSAEHHFVVRD